MSSPRTGTWLAILIASHLITLSIWLVSDAEPAARSDDQARLTAIEGRLERLHEIVVGAIERPVTPAATSRAPRESAAGKTEAASDAALDERLERIEVAIATLGEGIVALGALSAPAELPDFTSSAGLVAAGKFLDDGKYATAAEGFLEFARAHPEHPDRLDILDKARASLVRAGYFERAVDLQNEIIALDPAAADAHYNTLSQMYFDAKRYGEAATAIEESIARMPDGEPRLWSQMYRAWYIELADGPAAGIAAYRETDAARVALGVDNPKMIKKISAKITELENQLGG